MRHAVTTVVLFLLAGSLSAATFGPVSDATLVERAELVVAGDVLSSASRLRADRRIVTESVIAVRDVLKGQAGATITVTELGGSANGLALVIAGSAEYTPGTRVLAFLKTRPDGTYFTSHMALGQFRIEKHRSGIEVLVRNGEGIELADESALAPRHAQQFMKFVRDIVRGVPASDATAVTHAAAEKLDKFQPRSELSAADYVFKAGSPNRPIRWEGCDSSCLIGFFTNGTQPGVSDSMGGIDNAMDAWNDHPDSFVTLGRGGTSFVTDISVFDNENTILLNNSTSQSVGQCDSAIGCGLVWINDSGPTHQFDGSTFYSALAGDVVIRTQSYTQSAFEVLIMHELGHALALKHGPSGNLMSPSIPSSGLFLRSWDAEAMAEVYGEGVPCNPHTITGTSGGGTKPFGQSADLSVAISPTDAPVDYQWFRGTTGTTTEPVGSNSPTFTTPPIEAPMSFWVRVTSKCNPAFVQNSQTITVEPAPCNVPVITHHPQGQRVNPGGTATLNVAADGTLPFTYRWYRSATSGDETNQVGTQQTFTTPPLNTETSFWAKVSNACGSDNSDVATITVGTQCVPASITTHPASATVEPGSGATLGVVAAGDAPLAYQWFEGTAPDASKPIANATSSTFAAGPFTTPGSYRFWVRVTNACNQTGANSATAILTVPCPDPVKPVASVPPTNHRTLGYVISWTGFTGEGWRYEVQEAKNANFTDAITFPPVDGVIEKSIPAHAEITTDTRFFYRVRAISLCNNAMSAYSDPISTLIQAPPTPNIGENGGIFTPLGVGEDETNPVPQNFVVQSFSNSTSGHNPAATETFTLTSDQPWVTFNPPSGTIGTNGAAVTMTLNPSTLPVGSSSATVKLTVNDGAAAGNVDAQATTSVSIPISISKVTPVSPVPRDASAANTLIIPAVAHLDGVNTRFQSDVRIANASAESIHYDLSFTPSGTDGTQTGKRTTITIPAQGNFALDDLVQIWFGAGSLGELGSGTLEIRPKSTASGGTPNPFATFASSRLYAISDKGTLGQFIPALNASKFVGSFAADPLAKISLQQISNVAGGTFRTNLGFVEGSGSHVEMLVKVLDGNNALIAQKPLALGPFGHTQTSFASMFPGVNVADGRIEVQVTSQGGKATAYASVLDNKTSDPLMVFPEQPARVSSSRYVVPGVAELINGASNFHTDMRIYNAAATPVTVTLDYYPQAGDATPRPAAVNRTIAAGQTLAIDNVLPVLWNLSRTGGSVVVTAPNAASLVTTARTFSRDTNNGTYGQFIPGVTSADAVGLGERALEVLQLEDSTSYRSNLGLVEVTGNPVTIEVTARPPDSKITVVVPITLQGNEFRQIGRVFNQFGLQNVYNGRVSVKVIGGTGRVAAYGSVVDNRTVDPTYVPAQ